MHQLRELSDKIEAFGGEEAAAKWLTTTPLVRVKYPDKAAAINYAKCTIRSLLKPDEPHNQVARDQLALLVRDLGKPQGEETVRVVSATVEVEAAPVSQVVQSPVNAGSDITQSETGIVVHEGDWRFRIEAKTAQAAKAAVVSLTDLADRLGYERSSTLKELAEKPVHAEQLNKSGHIRVSRKSVACGNGFRTVDEPLYNKRQAMYLIAKSGTAIANDLTVEFIAALDSLQERFENQLVASPLVDPTSTILAFMREQQAATERANERRDALLLEGLKGLLVAAKPAPQNDPTHPVATAPAPRRTQEPKPTRQERFRFPVNRRMGLVKKIKAQIPADVDDYSKTIRTLWHGLYAEMERHGVSVLASVADYQLLHGEQIDYLDWIEQNGHLELAIRCAFALWPERKTAA